MDDIDKQYNNLLMNYYQDPQPQKVPAALEHFAASEFVKTQSTEVAGVMAYTFGRIAQLDSKLIPEYIKVFKRTTSEGRKFILMVFQICGNQQVADFLREKLIDQGYKNERDEIINVLSKELPVPFDPLLNDVENNDDLDFLWAEFFVTGRQEPINKIIKVLDWDDIFRLRLASWMSVKHSAKDIVQLSALLNDRAHIDVDVKKGKIKHEGDLDVLYSAFVNSSSVGNGLARDAVNIRLMLGLSEDEMRYISIKGAAIWSLRINSQQHPRVLEFCRLAMKTSSVKVENELKRIKSMVLENHEN